MQFWQRYPIVVAIIKIAAKRKHNMNYDSLANDTGRSTHITTLRRQTHSKKNHILAICEMPTEGHLGQFKHMQKHALVP